MNTHNIFTIQLEHSQEDTSDHTVSLNEWEDLRNNPYHTIVQLKKIKLSVYKEKLNVMHEQCKTKDDVILALKTCLDTYKNTNMNNNDIIVLLKSKLAERYTNLVQLKKSHTKQITDLEATISCQNDQVASQHTIIEQKDRRIAELEEKLRQQTDKYKEHIATLQTALVDSKMTGSSHEKKEVEYHISRPESEPINNTERVRNNRDLVRNLNTQVLSHPVTCKDSEKEKLRSQLQLSFGKIEQQNARMLDLSLKELQKSLGHAGTTEIKVISLHPIGPCKLAFANGTDGSGWIVIQRRISKIVNFNQGWFSYVYGFGDMKDDFWIGLDKIHAMTKTDQHELYMHLVFSNKQTCYAHYDNFAIGGKNEDYKIKSLGNYFGNAGDALRAHEYRQFRTIRYETKTTIEYNRWWQHQYPNCNLNGSFNEKTTFGVWWCRGKGNLKFVESVQMLIRPKQNFRINL